MDAKMQPPIWYWDLANAQSTLSEALQNLLTENPVRAYANLLDVKKRLDEGIKVASGQCAKCRGVFGNHFEMFDGTICDE